MADMQARQAGATMAIMIRLEAVVLKQRLNYGRAHVPTIYCSEILTLRMKRIGVEKVHVPAEMP